MSTKKLKTVSLDTMIDKHVGKVGTKRRDAFEYELKLELLGSAIKEARTHQNLTQEQLGQMVGVQKAQISKLEKENKKISNQVEKLNDQLGDLQIKNKKYVKEHEKNTNRIASMSNNQLSRVFADSFDE